MQTIISERTTKGGRASVQQPKHGGLLTELVFCETCGARMWLHWSKPNGVRPYPYYVCSGRSRRTCRAPFVRAEEMDESALDLLRALTIPAAWMPDILRYVEQQITAAQPASTIDTTAIERRLDRLKDIYQDGDLSRADYLKKRDALRSQLSQAAPPVVRPDLSRAIHLLGDMPTLLSAATPAQQRSLIHDVFVRFYIAWDGIKAITPTDVYSTLIEVMASEDGVADGSLLHHPHIVSFSLLIKLPRDRELIPR